MLFQTTQPFFGNTKTHICIHLWTRICCKECASGRFERHVSKRQRRCWFILVSWPTERKSSPLPNVYLTLHWHLPLSACGTTYLRYRGPIRLRKQPFLMIRQHCRDVYFSTPCYFFQPSNSCFVPLGVSRWALTLWPLTWRHTVDCYSSACELLYIKTRILTLT